MELPIDLPVTLLTGDKAVQTTLFQAVSGAGMLMVSETPCRIQDEQENTLFEYLGGTEIEGEQRIGSLVLEVAKSFFAMSEQASEETAP